MPKSPARPGGDSAAHHYLIHSYETIGRIADALKHGQAYVRLAPAVPHAHHMYGHGRATPASGYSEH